MCELCASVEQTLLVFFKCDFFPFEIAHVILGFLLIRAALNLMRTEVACLHLLTSHSSSPRCRRKWGWPRASVVSMPGLYRQALQKPGGRDDRNIVSSALSAAILSSSLLAPFHT